MFTKIKTVMFVVFLLIVSIQALPAVIKSPALMGKAGHIQLRELLLASDDLAMSKSSKFVQKKVAGHIVALRRELYEICFFIFDVNAGGWSVDIDFNRYIREAGLSACDSRKVMVMPGVIFHSFDSEAFHLNDGVHFTLLLRKVGTEDERDKNIHVIDTTSPASCVSGNLELHELLDASEIVSRCIAQKSTHKNLQGIILELRGKIYEIQFVCFENTAGLLPANTTLRKYVSQLRLRDLKSSRFGLYESFSTIDNFLGVYFNILMRDVTLRRGEGLLLSVKSFDDLTSFYSQSITEFMSEMDIT